MFFYYFLLLLLKLKPMSFCFSFSHLQLPSKPDKPSHHRPSSDQAIPTMSPDGESTTRSLSPQSVHLRPEMASRGTEIARNSPRFSLPDFVSVTDRLRHHCSSFSLAQFSLKTPLASHHKVDRCCYRPSPARPSLGRTHLQTPTMSHGQPANHRGCLL